MLRASSPLAIFGKYTLASYLPKPQEGACGCLCFSSFFVRLQLAALPQQVSLLRQAWDLHVTLSLHSCLTKPTSFHMSGSCFLSRGVLESALD